MVYGDRLRNIHFYEGIVASKVGAFTLKFALTFTAHTPFASNIYTVLTNIGVQSKKPWRCAHPLTRPQRAIFLGSVRNQWFAKHAGVTTQYRAVAGQQAAIAGGHPPSAEKRCSLRRRISPVHRFAGSAPGQSAYCYASVCPDIRVQKHVCLQCPDIPTFRTPPIWKTGGSRGLGRWLR